MINAEFGGTGELSSQQVRTQQLTLTLKPRIEQVIDDAHGQAQAVTWQVVVIAPSAVSDWAHNDRPAQLGEQLRAIAGQLDVPYLSILPHPRPPGDP